MKMDSKYSIKSSTSSIASTISNFLMKRKNGNHENGHNAKKQKFQTPIKNGHSPVSPAHLANSNGKAKKHHHNHHGHHNNNHHQQHQHQQQQSRTNQLSLAEQKMQLPVYSVKTA